MRYPMRILSLGAGVQSSTLAIMSERKDIEPFDCAIFADTGAEPRHGDNSVYDWLEYLEKQISFPVHIVRKGDLFKDSSIVKKSGKSGKLYVKGLVPAFVLKEDGKKGLLSRKCTADYKIQPIQKKIRELLGIKRVRNGHPTVNLAIGISTDEAHRMKPSRVPFIINYFPLIDVNMSRRDCIKYMDTHGYRIPPRSSCTFCPFHGDEEWRKLYGTSDFDQAVEFEKRLQSSARNQEALIGTPFLHPTCQPLDKINFTDVKSYQQLEMFGNECEGLCGV